MRPQSKAMGRLQIPIAQGESNEMRNISSFASVIEVGRGKVAGKLTVKGGNYNQMGLNDSKVDKAVTRERGDCLIGTSG